MPEAVFHRVALAQLLSAQLGRPRRGVHRLAQGDDFLEHQAQGVQVAGRAEPGLPLRLFGGHEAGGAAHLGATGIGDAACLVRIDLGALDVTRQSAAREKETRRLVIWSGDGGTNLVATLVVKYVINRPVGTPPSI